jgi:signal transduction histidine kinase
VIRVRWGRHNKKSFAGTAAPPARSLRQREKRFNLMRWFSLAALLSVAAVSVLSAWALSHFLTQRMIQREAEVTTVFVRNLIKTENAISVFTGIPDPNTHVGDFLNHMSTLPDTLRVNLFSADFKVLWSTEEGLVGQRFDDDDELVEAVRAARPVSSGIVTTADAPKSEHENIENDVVRFVENYIPVFDEDGSRVVGVVELYKVPNQLFDAIRDGIELIWLAALGAGIFLYATLFWIVRRAHHIIEFQREQLIENESLAVVGEMGTAVAHGLRNPLASIRSSAELALESQLPPQARECASDIVAQVDRLEGWTRQLLTYARPANAHIEAVDINAVLGEALDGFRRDLERAGTRSRLDLASDLPPICGEPAILQQLFASLIANSLEAMPRDGEIVLHSHFDADAGQVVVEVRDNGPGLSPDAARQAFMPFFTSKAKGLGLGLPLVRRVIERLGGSVALESQPGSGTTVRMSLRTFN